MRFFLRATNGPDRFLLVAALAGVIVWAFWQWRLPVAAQVEIYQGNSLYRVVPLAQNGVVAVPGPLGETLVEVADGRVRIKHSPCRNKFCMRAGWQAHAHDGAACLPNRVRIQLIGGKQGRSGTGGEEADYDAISE